MTRDEAINEAIAYADAARIDASMAMRKSHEGDGHGISVYAASAQANAASAMVYAIIAQLSAAKEST